MVNKETIYLKCLSNHSASCNKQDLQCCSLRWRPQWVMTNSGERSKRFNSKRARWYSDQQNPEPCFLYHFIFSHYRFGINNKHHLRWEHAQQMVMMGWCQAQSQQHLCLKDKMTKSTQIFDYFKWCPRMQQNHYTTLILGQMKNKYGPGLVNSWYNKAPRCFTSSVKTFTTCNAADASKPLVGSSSNNTFGSTTSSMPILTRRSSSTRGTNHSNQRCTLLVILIAILLSSPLFPFLAEIYARVAVSLQKSNCSLTVKTKVEYYRLEERNQMNGVEIRLRSWHRLPLKCHPFFRGIFGLQLHLIKLFSAPDGPIIAYIPPSSMDTFPVILCKTVLLSAVEYWMQPKFSSILRTVNCMYACSGDVATAFKLPLLILWVFASK